MISKEEKVIELRLEYLCFLASVLRTSYTGRKGRYPDYFEISEKVEANGMHCTRKQNH